MSCPNQKSIAIFAVSQRLGLDLAGICATKQNASNWIALLRNERVGKRRKRSGNDAILYNTWDYRRRCVGHCIIELVGH